MTQARTNQGARAVSEQPSQNGQVAPAEPKPPVEITRPIGNLDEMWRLANALAGSNLLPAAVRGKPNDVLVTILYGQELGLRPMQAIQGIYVVNGRPTIAGQLWLAKAREAGHKVQVLKHTADECTVKVTRGDTGEEHTETFTMADAKTAKLDQKDTYKAHPKRMLMWRAVSNACTFICPEIALGFGDEADRDPVPSERLDRPTLGDVAANRDAPVSAPPVDAELVEQHEAARQEAQRAEVLALAAAHTDIAGQGDVPVEDPPTMFDDEGWPDVTPAGGRP